MSRTSPPFLLGVAASSSEKRAARSMSRPKFYEPNERGFEKDVKKRIEYWNGLKKK